MTREDAPSFHFGRRAKLTYVVMLVPALLLLFASLYPFLQGILTALTNRKLYLPDAKFIGLGNFEALANTAVFWTALSNTLIYTALVVIIQIPLGLGIALLLDVPTRLRGFFRTTVVLPLLVPPVVAGLMWKTMMQPQSGVLNWLLQSVGLPPFSWLTDPATAMISVVLIDTWVFTPFAVIILLAGLQSVPTDIEEAARVDGANAWQVFRLIRLPWLLPYIVLVALFRVADSLKALEIIYATTRGGPLNATRTLHIMAYEEAYRWSSLGKAMAIVFVLWVICYLISGLLLGFWHKQEKARHAA
ncbi:carbohydrate ABC transporter permease [Bauldia litoralis]|uniref:Carbohydrate ABC transporter membrane protein 1, CUT1 family n=1 Tax=Bauldia litoralis TaxID=665467 RepID=A0A1G6BWA9_9HYPH|nr:sugar ABC transporter permease [Bauldia litoralis]SDB24890.1 carbohydrate ABC transporter membrane protein 1, CUT1 family [Bauldia litoralis]